MLVADPLQATCCTTSRSRVSAAAPIPVPTPVNKTASQKRTASGDWSVEGMMLPAAVGKDPEAVNFMGIVPQRLPSSAARLILQFDIDIMARVCPECTTSCHLWRQVMLSLFVGLL